VRRDLGEPGALLLADAAQQVTRASCRGGSLAREQLVQHGSGRVDVALGVDLLAARLLGRHVRELALDHTRVIDGRARPGDAEVRDLHLALERHEDVLRRDVAVDDVQQLHFRIPPPMRVVETLGDLAHHVGGDLDRERPRSVDGQPHQVGEVVALHVLHGDEVGVLGATEVDPALGLPRARAGARAARRDPVVRARDRVT
jgi:hypothetical protein